MVQLDKLKCKYVTGLYNLPSILLFTVHTAFGLPGSSLTAISDTSSPCLSTLKVDFGPLPQAMYNCGVSSLAKSATYDIMLEINTIGMQKMEIMPHLTSQARGQTVHFVNKHQIPQWPWGEEERVTFLQRHGWAEFGLVVVVSEVGNLIQVTANKKDYIKNNFMTL